ncbi:MAG: phosphomannomutase/phosphoglucomutase [Verrucomicrobia bacterium]|nr:phosphomannomutase/phosphoglucomutase [Verrucomicrobiota bacterium]MCH8512101.1 phosphomannomutase/phosphoglucomutase [Kiritimatiellia bacterium]
MSIFKAYDIRGIVGTELDENLARGIGRGFATLLSPTTVVIGRDMRPHSPALARALTEGLTLQGVNVVDIGMVSTPMCYFANGHLEADASIIITASHNPGEYNGFKLCRANAVPISGATGIQELEKIVLEEKFAPLPNSPGIRTEYDIRPEYLAHIRKFADIKRPLKIAVDYANAMGIAEGEVLKGLVEIDPLFDEYDGSFPNHEANPLDPETYGSLTKFVREGDYDFGIAFDGDADRVGFVDEHGEVISMDMITALIARALLEKEKGVVFYDLRSSKAVKELIEENGGEARMCRVGHAFIKQQMREANAVFAGELSGHYYFRENFFTESSGLAVLYIANLVGKSDKTLSELVKPIRKYVASGEINSKVAHPEAVFEKIRQEYADAHYFELDGLSVEYPDWWFNVRMSNTEPLCRLNLEAPTQAEMETQRDKALNLIRSC